MSIIHIILRNVQDHLRKFFVEGDLDYVQLQKDTKNIQTTLQQYHQQTLTTHAGGKSKVTSPDGIVFLIENHTWVSESDTDAWGLHVDIRPANFVLFQHREVDIRVSLQWFCEHHYPVKVRVQNDFVSYINDHLDWINSYLTKVSAHNTIVDEIAKDLCVTIDLMIELLTLKSESQYEIYESLIPTHENLLNFSNARKMMQINTLANVTNRLQIVIRTLQQ